MIFWWVFVWNSVMIWAAFWLSLTYIRRAKYRVIDRLLEFAPTRDHRQAMLDAAWFSRLLTMGEIIRLARKHDMGPQWAGGTDDRSRRKFSDP